MMGQSKEQFMEIRYKAEMSEDTFMDLPRHLKDEMELKAVEVLNFKEHYKLDKEWTKLNRVFIDSMKARQTREEEIRTALR